MNCKESVSISFGMGRCTLGVGILCVSLRKEEIGLKKSERHH